jgi:hypothetical protein
MRRTLLCALAGLFAGVALTSVLLRTALAVMRWVTAPKIFEMEHGVIYQGLILGAGFGAVTGALVGLAGVVYRSTSDASPKSHEPSASSTRASTNA